MVKDDDWRLTGQERCLRTAGKETLDRGHRSADGAHWVCPRCFEDFRDRFDRPVS